MPKNPKIRFLNQFVPTVHVSSAEMSIMLPSRYLRNRCVMRHNNRFTVEGSIKLSG
jgi:hypothetical protein